MARHILAIDQGTTGSTALVMGTNGSTLGRVNHEFAQHFPQPSWVEHEPEEIWTSVADAVRDALSQAGVTGNDIAAIGITNQRETALLWERASGKPVHRAIVWQDRRTSERCAELKAQGHEPRVREATGLVIDPYFSGTKIGWLLDHVPGLRPRANAGEIAFGTIDAFLAHRLTGGDRHVTDVTNASRTLLMDLKSRRWHAGMCELLGVPEKVLPEIVPSAGVIGRTRGLPMLPDGIPVSGMAGDQHAALFGQACFEPGEAKCTYGTGAFVLVNTGSRPIASRFGLLSTMGWQIGDEVVYALEGSAFIAGAAVQWLRDGLGIVRSAREIEALAKSVPSSDGVTFVPALAGLGAPHWDPEARGLICGITRGTTAAHLARATLEAIALEVNDLLRAMSDDLGTENEGAKGSSPRRTAISRIRVDGGAAANDLLMQLQSDLSAISVERPSELESTARGAAMLAGIGAGLFRSGHEAGRMVTIERTFTATMNEADRAKCLARWGDAVRRTRGRLT